MSGLMSYSGLTTKIRAMESSFITEKQFQEIAELPSVPQVVSYLKKNRGYAAVLSCLDENDLHRGQIEAVLRNAALEDFISLYRFSNREQRDFLKLYSRRFEIRLLKKCLSSVFDHRDITPYLQELKKYFDHYSDLDIEKLGASSTADEFVENLKDTDYYNGLKRLVKAEKPTLFDYETALDLYYFSFIWKRKNKILKKTDLELITAAYGNKFDMLNLWWIHRARHYFHMEPHEIYAMLVPVQYKLRKEQIRALVESETDEEFAARLADTYYAKIYTDLRPENLEDMYVYVLKHVLLKESRQHPYSAATIYSYLYQKEHEINRLIIALECIRYGLHSDETMKYLSKA